MIARMGMGHGRSAKLVSQDAGFNWYVDSVHGSDTNTGNSPGQAFQSINRLVNYNYVPYSEDFTQAAAGDMTISQAPSVTPPPGVGAAQYAQEDTANASRWIRLAAPNAPSGEITFSIYAKAGARSKLRLSMPWNSGYQFDLSAGTASSYGNDPDSWGIAAAGNGWYRCWITLNGGGPGTIYCYVWMLDASGDQTYTGDGVSGFYVAGAQVNTQSPALAGVHNNYPTAAPYGYVKTGAAGAQALSAHQAVGLACGSQWRESYPGSTAQGNTWLPSAPDYVTMTAYGSGAKPMFDCSDAVASYLWTQASGTTYYLLA